MSQPKSQSVRVTLRDGWNFGLGFWLAMIAISALPWLIGCTVLYWMAQLGSLAGG